MVQPYILLTLLIISAVHAISGLNSDAANLVLGAIRVVLTGAFIASNKTTSPPVLRALEQQTTLDSIPRDIRTVLSQLNVEPDFVRYACC
ncbi:hypothetical protein OH77DRAFT_1402453, partial [Trametes cingulata]